MFQASEENMMDVRILTNFLETSLIKESAEIVTYQQMSAAIGGRDVQQGGYTIMKRAIENVEETHGVYITKVTKVGCKIMTEFDGSADRCLKHISRTAKRTTKRILRAVKEDQMSPDESRTLFARLSAIAALSLFSKRSAIKKIETRLESTHTKQLATAETLRLFEK